MSDLKVALGDSVLSSVADQVKVDNIKKQADQISEAQKSGKTDKAVEAATQFEAVLVQQMMKSMWNTIPKDGMLTGSSEEKLYQDMLQQEVSAHISKYQSLGIKDMVVEELESREGGKKEG